MRIIYSTAFDTEQLPDVHLGGYPRFIWNILKTIYTLFIVLVVLGLPCLIALLITKKMGISSPVLLWVLIIGGLFLFPMAILNIAIGKDITMLRPDYLLKPIHRAFGPYLTPAALCIAAAVLAILTRQYSGATLAIKAGWLTANLAIQVIAIIAMRSIGLFHRHYSCHLPW
jgi:hypothetical protein